MKKFVSTFGVLLIPSLVVVSFLDFTIIGVSSYIKADSSYPDTEPIKRDGNVLSFIGKTLDSIVVDRIKYAS